MLVRIKLPIEPFNSLIRDGSVGGKIRKILDDLKPEAAYFTAVDGHRGGILVVDLPEPSKIPTIAEPWFLTFNATCEFSPCMTPDDLGKAGLDALGKKWG